MSWIYLPRHSAGWKSRGDGQVGRDFGTSCPDAKESSLHNVPPIICMAPFPSQGVCRSLQKAVINKKNSQRGLQQEPRIKTSLRARISVIDITQLYFSGIPRGHFHASKHLGLSSISLFFSLCLGACYSPRKSCSLFKF